MVSVLLKVNTKLLVIGLCHVKVRLRVVTLSTAISAKFLPKSDQVTLHIVVFLTAYTHHLLIILVFFKVCRLFPENLIQNRPHCQVFLLLVPQEAVDR